MVVGAAFNAVVQSFANDVLMGFVGAIFGQPNFNKLKVTCARKPRQQAREGCNGRRYGQFLTHL